MKRNFFNLTLVLAIAALTFPALLSPATAAVNRHHPNRTKNPGIFGYYRAPSHARQTQSSTTKKSISETTPTRSTNSQHSGPVNRFHPSGRSTGRSWGFWFFRR